MRNEKSIPRLLLIFIIFGCQIAVSHPLFLSLSLSLLLLVTETEFAISYFRSFIEALLLFLFFEERITHSLSLSLQSLLSIVVSFVYRSYFPHPILIKCEILSTSFENKADASEQEKCNRRLMRMEPMVFYTSLS